MFTVNDLAKLIGFVDDSMLSQLQVTRFDADCFESPSSEKSIIASRGAKIDFANAASFWLIALRADDWSRREQYFVPYAMSALCREITSEDVYQIISERTYDLRRDIPAFLNPGRRPLAAQLMYNDWDDVAFVVDYGPEFATFHWETTA